MTETFRFEDLAQSASVKVEGRAAANSLSTRLGHATLMHDRLRANRQGIEQQKE